MYLWFLAQILNSGGQKQLITAFGGLISGTGLISGRKSKIDCFTS